MKKNVNLDLMIDHFNSTYEPIDLDLRRHLRKHMMTAQTTLDIRANGRNATMTEEEISLGQGTFNIIFSDLMKNKEKEEATILDAIEKLRIMDIRRYNLWSLAITRDIPTNMNILLEMAHQPYHTDDDLNTNRMVRAAEKLRSLNEQMDLLQRLRDIYSEAAMI